MTALQELKQVQAVLDKAGILRATLALDKDRAVLAIAGFYSDVATRIWSDRIVIQVLRPWFRRSNRTRRLPDAIVYAFRIPRVVGRRARKRVQS